MSDRVSDRIPPLLRLRGMVAQQQQQQQQQWQSGRWTMVAECAGTHGLPLPGAARRGMATGGGAVQRGGVVHTASSPPLPAPS